MVQTSSTWFILIWGSMAMAILHVVDSGFSPSRDPEDSDHATAVPKKEHFASSSSSHRHRPKDNSPLRKITKTEIEVDTPEVHINQVIVNKTNRAGHSKITVNKLHISRKQHNDSSVKTTTTANGEQRSQGPQVQVLSRQGAGESDARESKTRRKFDENENQTKLKSTANAPPIVLVPKAEMEGKVNDRSSGQGGGRSVVGVGVGAGGKGENFTTNASRLPKLTATVSTTTITSSSTSRLSQIDKTAKKGQSAKDKESGMDRTMIAGHVKVQHQGRFALGIIGNGRTNSSSESEASPIKTKNQKSTSPSNDKGQTGNQVVKPGKSDGKTTENRTMMNAVNGQTTKFTESPSSRTVTMRSGNNGTPMTTGFVPRVTPTTRVTAEWRDSSVPKSKLKSNAKEFAWKSGDYVTAGPVISDDKEKNKNISTAASKSWKNIPGLNSNQNETSKLDNIIVKEIGQNEKFRLAKMGRTAGEKERTAGEKKAMSKSKKPGDMDGLSQSISDLDHSVDGGNAGEGSSTMAPKIRENLNLASRIESNKNTSTNDAPPFKQLFKISAGGKSENKIKSVSSLADSVVTVGPSQSAFSPGQGQGQGQVQVILNGNQTGFRSTLATEKTFTIQPADNTVKLEKAQGNVEQRTTDKNGKMGKMTTYTKKSGTLTIDKLSQSVAGSNSFTNAPHLVQRLFEESSSEEGAEENHTRFDPQLEDSHENETDHISLEESPTTDNRLGREELEKLAGSQSLSESDQRQILPPLQKLIEQLQMLPQLQKLLDQLQKIPHLQKLLDQVSKVEKEDDKNIKNELGSRSLNGGWKNGRKNDEGQGRTNASFITLSKTSREEGKIVSKPKSGAIAKGRAAVVVDRSREYRVDTSQYDEKAPGVTCMDAKELQKRMKGNKNNETGSFETSDCPANLPCQQWGSCSHLWPTGLIKADLSLNVEYEEEYFKGVLKGFSGAFIKAKRTNMKECYKYYGLTEKFQASDNDSTDDDKNKSDTTTSQEKGRRRRDSSQNQNFEGLTNCRARILDFRECFDLILWKGVC